MEIVELQVKLRSGSGKSYNNRMRNQGLVPAVVYGKEVDDNFNLLVPGQAMEKVIATSGHNAFLKIKIDDNNQEFSVLLREIQRHPVKGILNHLDFYQVSMSEKLDTAVPLVLVGEAVGVEQGGVLQHILREAEIRCLPLDIPNLIEVDVSQLEIGDSISVGEIKAPEGVEITSEPEEMIVLVAAPELEVEEDDEDEDILEDGEDVEAADGDEQESEEGQE